jgi:hypothetical protein
VVEAIALPVAPEATGRPQMCELFRALLLRATTQEVHQHGLLHAPHIPATRGNAARQHRARLPADGAAVPQNVNFVPWLVILAGRTRVVAVAPQTLPLAMRAALPLVVLWLVDQPMQMLLKRGDLRQDA